MRSGHGKIGVRAAFALPGLAAVLVLAVSVLAASVLVGAMVAPASAQRVKEPPKADRKKPFSADMQVVVLQGLNKLNAKISTFGGRVGTTVTFGTLRITLRRCQRNRPENPPERGVFLEIREVPTGTKPGDTSAKTKLVFSGWMFASNPALNPLEHPIYDVWVRDCK